MELIAIGRILKPIGVKGEVKINPLTDDRQRFAALQSVMIGWNETEVQQCDILSFRIDSKQIILLLSGFINVTEAEQLRGKYLFVPRDRVVKLHKGSYFVDDIIGCEVFTEKKMKVGIISDLYSLPSNDIWIVRDGKKEFLIPAVKDIIHSVDVKKKLITIHALEGLLD